MGWEERRGKSKSKGVWVAMLLMPVHAEEGRLGRRMSMIREEYMSTYRKQEAGMAHRQA